MNFFWKKVRLLAFLTRRVSRLGWRQWRTGLRQRNVSYAAMELEKILPEKIATVIDVGGHHGDFAAALDFLYAPKCLVVVEPNPQLTVPLQTRFHGQSHITIVPACLGRSAGEVTLNVHDFDAASSLYTCQPGHLEKFGLSGASHAESVPMITLAQLLEHEAIAQVDLLKLDCQGAELDVLRGAGDRLRHVRWVFCEVSFDAIYADAPLFGEVHQFLRAAGFELHSLGEFAGAGRSLQWGDALYRNAQP